jgi:translation elongation factor EF-G
VSRTIINDILSARRGRIIDILDEGSKFGHLESTRTLIRGFVPLEATIGYTTFLRSVSKGGANLVMKL